MRILLATDLSPEAEIAQTLVMGMPLQCGSRIRVVLALEPLATVSMLATGAMLDALGPAVEEARRELAKVTRILERPRVEIETAVVLGRAADVIVDECAAFQPDIIVMGNRGRGAIATNLLGSVSAEVIDRASAPVLIARRPTLTNVVLAEDGSSSAAAGARVLAGYAPFANASVHVVSVTDVPYPMVLADPTGTDTAVEAFASFQRSLSDTRTRQDATLSVRLHALRDLGIHASAERRDGRAAHELVAAAVECNADCIVIGGRGHTGLRRMMLGSVARSVLYHAPCSVLIAHDTSSVERAPRGRELATVSGKEV